MLKKLRNLLSIAILALVMVSANVPQNQANALGIYFGAVQSGQTKLFKSVQSGEITIGSASTSNTATLSTAVNTSNSLVLYQGMRTAGTSNTPDKQYARLDLTDGSTVTAYTNTADGSNTRIVRYAVVEFYPGIVKSIQKGTNTIAAGSTSQTTTVSSVTTANSFVAWNGATTNNTDATYARDLECNTAIAVLTNSTTLTFSRQFSRGDLVTAYTLVEFNPGIVNSIQQIDNTILGATGQTDTTITAVGSTAWMVWGGWRVNNAVLVEATDRIPYCYRTSTTNVRCQRANTSTSVQSRSTPTIIDFKSYLVNSQQSAQTGITSTNSSANATITSVNTSKSALSWLGFSNSGGVASPADHSPTAKINSATQVTIERGGTGSNTTTNSWEVLESK